MILRRTFSRWIFIKSQSQIQTNLKESCKIDESQNKSDWMNAQNHLEASLV